MAGRRQGSSCGVAGQQCRVGVVGQQWQGSSGRAGGVAWQQQRRLARAWQGSSGRAVWRSGRAVAGSTGRAAVWRSGRAAVQGGTLSGLHYPPFL